MLPFLLHIHFSAEPPTFLFVEPSVFDGSDVIMFCFKFPYFYNCLTVTLSGGSVKDQRLDSCYRNWLNIFCFTDFFFCASSATYRSPSRERDTINVVAGSMDAGLFISDRMDSFNFIFDESIFFKNIIIIFADIRGNPFHSEGCFGHLPGCR
jgi:hypothetical protein